MAWWRHHQVSCLTSRLARQMRSLAVRVRSNTVV